MQQMTRPAGPTLRVSEQCRVVLDNDWSGDPDGLVALAHHLLSTGQPGRGGDQLLPQPRVPRPAAPGGGRRALAGELLAVVGGAAAPVHIGSEEPFGDGE